MLRTPTFRSKKELVYDFLRTAVLQGGLKPGSRLVIDEVAMELGVSQIPVREALQQLEADGFVTIEPYVGATVTEIHTGLIAEVFELLEAMETISVQAACRRMSDEDLNELEDILRGMDDLTEDPDRFSQENVRLHQFICDRAEVPLVKNLMSKVLDHWDRLRRYYLNDVFSRRIGIAQQEHWHMLEALRIRDPDQVEQVICKHNRTALAAYTHHLKATTQPAIIDDTKQ